MPKLSQLEIISPGGEIQFHDLDPAKGVANIGQHPDNDIVIKSPGVAPFHAVVDHRQRPYQIMLFTEDGQTTLRGEPLAANVFQELDDWDTIEIDGHAIILLEGAEVPVASEPLDTHVPLAIPAAAAAVSVLALEQESEPAMLVETVGLPARPADQIDEVIVAEIEEREWLIDVEQAATCELTIVNGGDLVATFVVVVEGLDESWVTISAPQINLYEGGRAAVAITMQPPRLPTSTAGHHHLAVVITSPNYPGRMSRLGATLTINPYYEFAVGELSPKQQTVRWRKRTGQVTLPVTNKGNSETPFRFEGEDDERACRFEFEVPGEEALFVRQAEIRIEPGTARVLTTHVTPIRRRLFALRKRSHSYTITTTLVEGAQMPRAVMGQLKSSALFGPLLPLLMLLLLAVMTVILFRPTSLPVLVTDNATPASGEAVTLSYWAYRFPRWSSQNLLNRLNALFLGLRMEHQPTDGEWQTLYTSADFEEAVGKKSDVPLENGRYRMLADTWLSKLIPRLQGVSLEVPVYVDPVEPEISEFSADRTTVFAGDTVTLYWQARDADSLILEYNGIQETLEENEMEQGTRSMTMEQNTTFSLVATNSSWPQEKRRPLLVAVLVPTVTPPPTPIILRFDVDPLEITAGETIRVSWEVMGADTVDITPLGAGLPLKGDVGAEPGASTFYELTAFKSAEDGTQVKNQSLLQEVVVNPEPSPTPEPEMPVIAVFEPTPKEVIAGEGKSVKLTWSVTGDTTNVQIAAPGLAFDGLASQDVVTVTVDETTLFILSAVNGDLKTSQAVEVKAIPPSPTPEPTEPPPPPTPVPTPIPPPVFVYYKAEGLNPVDDKVTYRGALETANGWVYEYDVQPGSMVKLSWKVAGAEIVTLGDYGPQPAESTFTLPDPVLASALYVLTGQLEDPEYGPSAVSAYVKLDLVAPPPPPPPFNLSGQETTDDDDKPVIALKWFYDRAFIEEIDGFRVYRADVSGTGSEVFQPVKVMFREDAWLNRSEYDWTDALKEVEPEGRTCGFAYYVTAFYWDIMENREQETNASTTSYYSTPCN